jgi:hypothetical protein
MKTKTSSTPDAPAIVFKTNVMIPASEPGTMSTIITAGEPSPWHRIEDVPSTLRDLVGKPRRLPPPDTENQRWTPPQILEMEREAIARLNSREEMSDSLAAEFEARDAAYLRESANRNRVETEIENREEADRKRRVREMEEENRRKLKGTYE